MTARRDASVICFRCGRLRAGILAIAKNRRFARLQLIHAAGRVKRRIPNFALGKNGSFAGEFRKTCKLYAIAA